MVIQHVEKHGTITRKEVAELCRLAPDQPYRLLKKLVRRGQLNIVGSRKAAWYERNV